MKIFVFIVSLIVMTGFSVSADAGGKKKMKWVVTDMCPDSQSFEFRFRDYQNGWLWPGGSNSYFSNGYGVKSKVVLKCRKNAKICIGGQSYYGDNSWGVGLYGGLTCENCCARCDGGTYTYKPSC